MRGDYIFSHHIFSVKNTNQFVKVFWGLNLRIELFFNINVSFDVIGFLLQLA